VARSTGLSRQKPRFLPAGKERCPLNAPQAHSANQPTAGGNGGDVRKTAKGSFSN
jgi:hypothetical protein